VADAREMGVEGRSAASIPAAVVDASRPATGAEVMVVSPAPSLTSAV